MKIHKTAIVEEGAELGAGVEIGPFSIVGPQAKIGDNCRLQSHVVIEGPVSMGADNVVGHGSVIGTPPQDVSFHPQTQSRVEIGRANVIREYCTIHRSATEGNATILGDRNFLMVGVHIGHDCHIGSDVIIVNNSMLGGHVRVDDRAFIAGGSRFHQNTRVGRIVLAEGGFNRSLPPFLIASRNHVYGVNLIGLRRAGFSAENRDEIKRAFKLLYRSELNTEQALKEAAALDFGPIGREFFDFVGTVGKRGIVPYRSGREPRMGY